MLAASSFCRPPKCSISPSEVRRGSLGTLASSRYPCGLTRSSRASAPGCPGATAEAPAGTYSATAQDGSLASNSVTFRVA